MSTWFTSRKLTAAGMVLVTGSLLAAGYTGLSFLVAWLPWLGLLCCLHFLARGRSLPGATGSAPDRGLAAEFMGENRRQSRRVEESLSDRLILERTTTAILEDYVHCGLGDFEENMSRVLSRLGSFVGANRCYLYRRIGPDQQYARRLTWQVPGDHETALPPHAFAADEALRSESISGEAPVVLVNDVSETCDPGSGILAWSRSQADVRSCGGVRIMQDGKDMGFLGFDANAKSDWGGDVNNLLLLVANLFSTLFSRLDAQQQRIQAMATLQANSKAKSEFLANMSHEIRTPLNGVIATSDLLKEMSLTTLQEEYVDIIRMSGSTLMSLINDVLDMSKIEAGQLLLDPVDTDLRVMVEDIVGLSAFDPQMRGLELIWRVDPVLPERIVVDPGRVRQVVSNLLSNAAKFTRDGHVYMEVTAAAEQGRQGNQLVLRFQITDTGIGINQEHADRLFDKFIQADNSTTRRFGGTGLGLSICRHLVELMGGRISAKGVRGEGSEFSFTISVQPVETAAPAMLPSRGQEVVLVTGHELGGTVLAEQISHLGHHCRIVTAAVEARSLLSRIADGNSEQITTIIVDPSTLTAGEDLDSLRVQDIPEAVRPQVILLSQPAIMPLDAEQEVAGLAGILSKPVRMAQLAALLAEDHAATSDREENIGAAGHSESRKPEGQYEGTRILLAEDNVFNQRVIGDTFKRLGCQVSLAGNGAQALAMAEDGEYDLIFMDCQMPEMDGYEATRRIREIPREIARIPIIALTANAFQGDREACLSAGMDDYMTKPVSKDQLSKVLAIWEPAQAGENRRSC